MTYDMSLKDARAWLDARQRLESLRILDVEGFEPGAQPSPIVFRAAARFLTTMLEGGYEAPTRVVPDGTGGIAFETDAPNTHVCITLTAAGPIELVSVDLKRRSCRRVPLGNFTQAPEPDVLVLRSTVPASVSSSKPDAS